MTKERRQLTKRIQAKVKYLCDELCLPMPTKSDTVGRYGELLAYKKLRESGHKVVMVENEYDLLVDGKVKYEIKTSLVGLSGRYAFSFRKNRDKQGNLKYDRALLVMIPDLDSEPSIIEQTVL